MSHQLNHLREHGFITARWQGRQLIYRIVDTHVLELIDPGVLASGEHVQFGGVANHDPLRSPSAP